MGFSILAGQPGLTITLNKQASIFPFPIEPPGLSAS